MYIFMAILVFGFLIFIHELGHFVAAKKLGVQVNEFAIGMGPVLFQRVRGETAYSLRLFPIGGFCAMEGEDEENEANPRAFHSVSWWRRLIILVAGSFMNLLAGFLIVLVLLSGSEGFYTAEVTSFFDNGNLAAQGLQVGDTLYKIDGERVYIYDDVGMLLERNQDGVFDFVVLRGGKKVELKQFEMRPGYYEVDGETVYKYGITFGNVEEATVGTTLRNAWYNSIDFARLVRLGLQDLLTGNVALKDMSGPVGIVSVITESGQAAEESGGISAGIMQVLYLAAFIAINLAVMNLLPIPAVDGGRVVGLLLTTAIEKITRRKVNPKYEGYIHAAGMLLLLAFMAIISFKDIFTIVKG